MLTNQIVRDPATPSVSHLEFDPFDQLINDLTGMGYVHTAHVIMMHGVYGDGSTLPETQTVPITSQ